MSVSAPTPWFFRCEGRVYPLPVGTHVVGRSAKAAVALDDDLASRRHAEVEVDPETVRIRDLGSRNGVYVQGERLAEGEVAELANGQSVIIGRSRLTLMRERKRGRLQTLDGTATRRPTVRPPGMTGSTKVGTPHESFLDDADRAAAVGDWARLEKVTRMSLQMVVNALSKGMPGDDPAVERAAQHALTLAAARGQGWLEQIFVLYEAARLPIPIDALTKIEALAGTVGFASRAPLGSYIETMRPALEADARGRALLTQLLRVLSR